MGPIQMRPARPADTATIAEIWETGWRDGHLGNVPELLVAARTPESFRTRAAECLPKATVAEIDGEVAGFVMVGRDEVEQVYVAAAHRGTGVAAVLLAEAERQVAAGGHPVAWLAVAPGNGRARRFYERRGWSDDGGFDYAVAPNGVTILVPCRRYTKQVGGTAS